VKVNVASCRVDQNQLKAVSNSGLGERIGDTLFETSFIFRDGEPGYFLQQLPDGNLPFQAIQDLPNHGKRIFFQPGTGHSILPVGRLSRPQDSRPGGCDPGMMYLSESGL